VGRHITLLSYHLKEDAEEEFLSTWRLLNDLNFRYAGCLGARIHRRDTYLNYYEYTIWPDKDTYQRSSSLLPPAALALRARLRACCKRVEEAVELELLAEHLNKKLRRDFT